MTNTCVLTVDVELPTVFQGGVINKGCSSSARQDLPAVLHGRHKRHCTRGSVTVRTRLQQKRSVMGWEDLNTTKHFFATMKKNLLQNINMPTFFLDFQCWSSEYNFGFSVRACYTPTFLLMRQTIKHTYDKYIIHKSISVRILDWYNFVCVSGVIHNPFQDLAFSGEFFLTDFLRFIFKRPTQNTTQKERTHIHASSGIRIRWD